MSRLRTTLGFVCCLLFTLTAPALAAASYATSDSGSDERSASYREGQRALDSKQWDAASKIFGKIASGSSAEADAALHWKAYADWKQKRKKESLEGVRQLLATYPQSRWADDAKALELEIRDGKPAASKPDADDEELKLYALDGLMQVESEKAVPVLEKLLAGNSSPRIKERALFVLSQSDSPRAREILVRTAKTGQPVALRCEAVKTLGIAGDPDDLAALAAIARDATAPPEVRDAVIDAYITADRPEELLAIAKSDPDSRIRAKAIDALGAIDALPSLKQLWGTEKDPALRAKLLEAFGVAGDVDELAKVARESTDPQIRRKAIEGIGISNNPMASDTLRRMYAEFAAQDDKRKVLEALMIHGDAKTLVALFHAEKDPAMKKAILQQISVMDDPDATRTLLDVLGE
jgi:HEAT repeat protein